MGGVKVSYKRKYKPEEIADAKFRKGVMKAAANDIKLKIQRLEHELKKLKEDWHRLNAESYTPIRKSIRKMRKENNGF